MKTNNFFSGFLGLLVLLFIVSCNAKEPGAPSPDMTVSPDGIPELIDISEEYDLLDQFPAYAGGDGQFRDYLKTHIKYPQKAIDSHVSGKVFASFIVEKDGTFSNLEILKGIGYGCDEEVLKVLRNMPAWSPGKIGNQSVRVKMVIPVAFEKD
jgi:protein TonB